MIRGDARIISRLAENQDIPVETKGVVVTLNHKREFLNYHEALGYLKGWRDANEDG
jgi:hypothetical protein